MVELVILHNLRGKDQRNAASGDDTVTWIPPVDIYETDLHYVLDAEVPGVDGKDLRVEIAGSRLSISGERRFDESCSDSNYHRVEGIRGRFHRTFSLPEPLDSQNTSAELCDGVLHLILPKIQRSRRVPVRSSRSSMGAGDQDARHG